MKPEVKYPYEYFAAPVYFAVKIAEILRMPLADEFAEYTGLYTEVTGIDWRNDKTSPIWSDFLEKIGSSTDPEYISKVMYETYLDQPHSIFQPEKTPEGISRFGPFGLDYNEYNRERNTVRLHFMPQRQAVSELATERFDELREHFKALLQYTKEHHPEVKNFTCSTWVNAIPNFRRLFPQTFLDRMQDIGGSSYLGIWGQFVKSDGSGNINRFNQFVQGLSNAKTVEEAVDAFPFKVLEAVGPLDDFYKEYTIS